VYYRYLYFHENGRVLYALTSASPVEMFGRFLRMCLNPSETDEAAVWGTYQVHKRRVTVTARQPWQYVKFEMTIQPSNLHGRYGMLSLDQHISNTTPDFDAASHCPHRVQYEVPEEPFRFVRDKRL
jgi:F-box protein 9